MTDRKLARALGWFSYGLGIPQVLMPGRVNKLVGIRNTLGRRQLMRMVGMRELTGAAGIFTSQPKPAEWLWARVAGDAMDLALLTAAMGDRKNHRLRLALAGASVAGVAALDVAAAMKHRRALKDGGEGLALKGGSAITINRPPDEVYRRWRSLEDLPEFMFHLKSVQPLGGNRYHWVANAPLGKNVEWDAEIIDDRPGELIAWRSAEGAAVPNSGSVRFIPAPGNRGTEVVVEVEYRLPGGAIADTVARLFGEEPVQQVKDDLRRFKQVVETGEVVRSDGAPDGAHTVAQFKWRPAQPLPDASLERSGA